MVMIQLTGQNSNYLLRTISTNDCRTSLINRKNSRVRLSSVRRTAKLGGIGVAEGTGKIHKRAEDLQGVQGLLRYSGDETSTTMLNARSMSFGSMCVKRTSSVSSIKLQSEQHFQNKYKGGLALYAFHGKVKFALKPLKLRPLMVGLLLHGMSFLLPFCKNDQKSNN